MCVWGDDKDPYLDDKDAELSWVCGLIFFSANGFQRPGSELTIVMDLPELRTISIPHSCKGLPV